VDRNSDASGIRRWRALGGFVGAGSTVVNGRISRSDRGALSKYALVAVTKVAGTAVFFVIAIANQIAIGPRK
jgi:hypothetical protein